MKTDRIKEIQQKTAYPDSISVQQALLKVWNECEQRDKTTITAKTAERILLKVLSMCEMSEITDDKQREAIAEIKNELKEHVIEFLDFITSENSPYVILYGEACRLATKLEDFTIEQVYADWINSK